MLIEYYLQIYKKFTQWRTYHWPMLGPDMEPNDSSTFATLAASLGPLSAQP